MGNRTGHVRGPAALLAALLLSGCAAGAARTGSAPLLPAPDPATLTRPADCPELFWADREGICAFAAHGASWTVDAAGRVTRAHGAAAQTVRLALDENDFVESVQFIPHGEDVVVFGVSNGDSAAGKVARLGDDPLAVRWTVHVPGFNLSPGWVDGGSLYQAAIGFVGKIDLETGRYAWRHENLYGIRSYGGHAAFNAFAAPRRDGGDILFYDHPYPERSTVWVIRVNDRRGDMTVEQGRATDD